MTNEEAKEILNRVEIAKPIKFEDYADMREALNMAIKALEQQNCEDAISRDVVEKITWEEPSYDDALNVLTEVRDKVRALPSVKPNPVFYPPCQDCNTKMDEVRKAYDKLRWITNHEILPEDLQRVLITTLKGYVTDYIHMDDVSIWDFAIAWMPAPEPYKGGM